MSGGKTAYRLSAKDVLAQFESSKDGLKQSQVSKLQHMYGSNKLKQLHKESIFIKYLRQFKDPMIALLIFSSILAFFLEDPRVAVVILGLVAFNTIVGFTQEYKAEKLMQSLEKLVVSKARVIRDGKIEEIDASELVPGDVVLVSAGESVPADLRVLEETELSTNDFALTGESNPSRKFTHAIESDVELANRHNLVFMGTTVANGEARGVVIGTGMQTELGKIASLSDETAADPSPLQKEMSNIAKRVTQGTIILCILLLPVAIKFGDLSLKGALLFALGFAASIIPQGLPAEINTALAQAAAKLAKARALVKKLSAVETLGATNIICTDKTGTLTKNEMTVEQLLIGKDVYTVTGSGYESNGSVVGERHKALDAAKLQDLSLFFTTGALASNARVQPPDNEHATWYCLGDPTEGALITLARKAGLEPDSLETASPEIKEFSFDSARKRMTSIRKMGPHGQYYVLVKGAPEGVLERSDELWDHGHVRKLSQADRNHVLDTHNQWAENAMRNLAFAYKVLPADTDIKKLKMEDAEQGLTFLGLVSMIDPLREDVAEAMKAAHVAHIDVSIITGDFATTAKAIATKAGLGTKDSHILVISGQELHEIDDTRLLQLLDRGSVIFSRVSPEDKLRIVALAKERGNVVAVTGDGINDAPALKRADIGVAMGKTGTDVAKQSAEIVLLDDSFHTLVGAIQQGRIIFQNIKKGTLSCFTSNSAELIVNLTSLVALISFGVPLALSVMQILAIDLIAELFPIAALGWDKADSDLMREKPRNPRDHILNRWSITDLLWCGVLIGGLAFANYILFFWRNGIGAVGADITNPTLYIKATSITYLTIVLCQLANILQRRSEHGLFTRYQFHNKQFWIAIAVSMFLVCVILYNPVVAPYFGAGPLSLVDWLYALGAAAIFIAFREVQRHANTHHTREHIFELHSSSVKP